jgi:hypothetical protein
VPWPHWTFTGIALDHLDLVGLNAELFGDELGKGGLVALALGLGAAVDHHRSGRAEADLGRLVQADAGADGAGNVGGRKPAGLDIGRQPDAAQLAGLLRGGAARRKTVIVGKLERLVERRPVIAAVIEQRHRGLVGEGVGLDEVAPPQSRCADAELPPGRLHEALDHIGGFRAPRAALGIDGAGVGEHALDRAVDGRDDVLARQQRGIEIGRH